jgi:hypothetical protein
MQRRFARHVLCSSFVVSRSTPSASSQLLAMTASHQLLYFLLLLLCLLLFWFLFLFLC